MFDIEEFLENPGERDVRMHEVFTDEMFSTVFSSIPEHMRRRKLPHFWKDYRNRRIVSEFMQDDELGNKRLISMPDRFSNSIEVIGSTELVLRPTIINAYEKDLSSISQWFEKWMTFIFFYPVASTDSDGNFIGFPWVYTLIPIINKAKYPAITTEENESHPLFEPL
jgi:hypothetical protein